MVVGSASINRPLTFCGSKAADRVPVFSESASLRYVRLQAENPKGALGFPLLDRDIEIV